MPIARRKFTGSVLVPTVLVSAASSALLPVIPSIVGSTDEGLALAGVAVAMLVVGQVIGVMPGGIVSGTRGDRFALASAGVIGAIGSSVILLSELFPGFLLLGLLIIGTATGIHSVARHAFLTDALSGDERSKALAWVSGMLRGGAIFGPFGAAAVLFIGLRPIEVSYVAATAFSLVALIHLLSPSTAALRVDGFLAVPGVIAQLKARQGRLLFVASASAVVSGLRAGRLLVVPLWGAAIQLEPGLIALAVGIAAVADFAVFPLAARLMRSRSITMSGAISTAGLTFGVFALCLVSGPVGFVVATLGLGVASGLGSGYLLAIASVEVDGTGRSGPVLGALRTISDGGSALVPIAVGIVAGTFSLLAATILLGAVGVASSLLTLTVLRPSSDPNPVPRE